MRYKLSNRKVLFVNNDSTYTLFEAYIKQCNARVQYAGKDEHGKSCMKTRTCGVKYVTKTWKSGIEALYGTGIREELGRRGIRVSPVKRGCANCAEGVIAKDAMLRRSLMR